MADEEESVSLSLDDLEVIHDTLSAVHNLLTVMDLTEQYRKLSARPTPSRLTKSVQASRDRVADLILDLAQPETEEGEDD